jgi:hypothetical protein
MRRILPAILAALAAGTLCACQPGSTTRPDLRNLLAECSAEHGYDPDHPPALGPYTLAPTEPAFFECVYHLTKVSVIPHSLVPEGYRALIAEHRAMTAALERGELTREQRRARTRAFLDALQDKERVEEARLQAQMARDGRDALEQSREARDLARSDLQRALGGGSER